MRQHSGVLTSFRASSTTSGRPILLDQVLSDCGLGFFHGRLLVTCGFGFSAAAVEAVLAAFLFNELRAHWNLNEYQLGALPSLVSFGSTIGEIFWGSIADSCGRRPVFMATVVIVVTFGVLSALSPTFLWLYLFRFIVGFGYGGNIAVDFAIFTELLPTEGRGDMLFYVSAFWPVGQAATCLLAWAVIPTLGWRGFLVICAIPTLITAFLRPLIPESPRWLLLKGRDEEALEVCRHIAEKNGKRLEDVGLVSGARLVLASDIQRRPRASSRTSSRASTAAQGEEAIRYLPNVAKGSREGAKLFALRASQFGSASFSSSSSPLGGGARARSYSRFALRAAQSAKLGALGRTTVEQKPLANDPGVLALQWWAWRRRIWRHYVHAHVPKEQNGLEGPSMYQTMLLNAVFQFPGLALAMWVSSRYGRRLPLQLALFFIAASLAVFSFAKTYLLIIACTCFACCSLEFGWATFHVYTPEVFPTELRATALGFITAFGSVASASAPFAAAYLLTEATALHVIMFFSTICAVVCCTTAVLFWLETLDRDLPDRASSPSSFSSARRDRASSGGSTFRVELADTPLNSRAGTPATPPHATPLNSCAAVPARHSLAAAPEAPSTAEAPVWAVSGLSS